MSSTGWSSITPGRTLIFMGNLIYSAGAFAADWSDTHVFNPRWPPHAKFHNGQTMSLGVLLATSSIYFAFRPASNPRDSLWTAALIGTFYCLSGLSAILYPGSHWKDPESPGPEGGAQQYIFAIVCVVMWVGYWLDAPKTSTGGAGEIGKGKKV